MPDKVVVRGGLRLMQLYRRELLRALRVEAQRVRKSVQGEMRRDTGNARRRLKLKTGFDSRGPYARIVTTARRVSKNKDGEYTSFRYALAQQQKEHYLQRGLQRTPRR
jgi:hypothetical protein